MAKLFKRFSGWVKKPQAGSRAAIRSLQLKKVEEMEALRQTALDIAAQSDRDSLLQTIIQRAANLLQATGGGIYEFDASRRELTVIADWGSQASIVGTSLKVGEGMAGQVVQTWEPLIVDDYRSWPGRAPVFAPGLFRAVIEVPLRWEDRILGVLYVTDDAEGRSFSQEDARLLSLLASQAAIALGKAEMLERTQRNLAQLEALQQLSARISAALSLDAILQLTLSEGLRAIRATEGSIMFVRPSTNELEIIAWLVQGEFVPEKTHRRFALGEGIAGHVAVSGQAYNCPDVFKDPRFVGSFTGRDVRSMLSVPIVSHGRVLGTINCDSRQVGFFKEDDALFLSSLASHLAIAIESHQLREVGLVLSTLSLDQVLSKLVESASILSGAEFSTIFLLDGKTGELRRAANFPASRETRGGPRKNGLSALILSSGEPLVIVDAQHDPRVKQASKDQGIKSIMGIPLKIRVEHDDPAGGKPIGVLFVNTRQARAFTDHDVQLLQGLANRAAVAIENATLFERLESERARREAESRALQAVGISMTETIELNGILDRVMQAAIELTQADEGSILFYDQAKDEFLARALMSKGVGRPLEAYTTRVRQRAGLAYEIVSGRKAISIADTRLDSRISKVAIEKGRRAMVGVPLLNHEGPAGVLWVNWKEPRQVSAGEADLLIALASQAAVAIQGAERYAEIQEHARLREGLLKAGQAIVALKEPYQVFQSIANRVREALECDVVTLYTYDPVNHTIGFPPSVAGDLYSPEGIAQLSYVSQESVVGKLLASGEPNFADDSLSDPLMSSASFVAREKIRSSAGIPLRIGEEILGILFVNYREFNPFTAQKTDAINLFSNLAAIAIHNAKQYDSLREARDELLAAGAIAWMGLFGADWSHSVAQKTMPIRNYATVVKKQIAREDLRRYLEKIDALAQEIQDVPLAIASPADLDKVESLPVGPSAHEMIQAWCARHEHIKLQVELKCGGARAKIDKTLLRMSLQKLVDNSIRHMPGGGMLALNSRVTPDRFVALLLTDTGTGIPAEYRPLIGRRRIPKQEGETGSGMGTLIASFILRKYGGELMLVWSEEGKGTCWQILLPICE